MQPLQVATVVVFALVSFLAVRVVHSHKDGAPLGACDTLTPEHGPKTQKTVSPYTLDAIKLPKENKYKVTIQTSNFNSRDPSTLFRGFILQARDDEDQLVGSFEFDENHAKDLPCSTESHKATLTHVNSKLKQRVEVEWIPPTANEFHGKVQFRATVVQTKAVFWTGLEYDAQVELQRGVGGIDDEWDWSSASTTSAAVLTFVVNAVVAYLF